MVRAQSLWLLARFLEKSVAGWVKKTLGDVLEEVVNLHPDNPALIFKDQLISYGQLWERV